jgi:membrane protein YdbS with pleckstrin-like domain
MDIPAWVGWSLVAGTALIMTIFFLATDQPTELAVAAGFVTIVVGVLALFVVPLIENDRKEK